jgi:hypothetical protein
MNDLRFTDTNSADDSRGVTWGLRGNLLWIVLGGAVLSLSAFLVLYSWFSASLKTAGFLACLPVLIALTYAVLKQSHPPGWDVDLLDGWLNGRGFSPRHLTVPTRGAGVDGFTSAH